MKKRLRKKKHLGEFTEWGRQLVIMRNRKDKFDEFLNTLMTEMASSTLRQFETKWLKGLKNKELLAEWRARGLGDDFAVRMGISTGFCTVGNFGSEERLYGLG